jgi:pyruvate ferredoxin oxidoreductase gamma subunit
MIEISWHGRGGQGAFTAARLLAHAWMLKDEGNFALAFPTFGPERRGAPIRAFSKLSTAPIANRGEIEKSDFVVLLDDSLLDEAALPSLKEGGWIIVNSRKSYDAARRPSIVAFDAAAIAERALGIPVVNTAMLGAIAALSPIICPDDIGRAIEKSMPKRLWEGNRNAARMAKETIR